MRINYIYSHFLENEQALPCGSNRARDAHALPCGSNRARDANAIIFLIKILKILKN